MNSKLFNVFLILIVFPDIYAISNNEEGQEKTYGEAPSQQKDDASGEEGAHQVARYYETATQPSIKVTRDSDIGSFGSDGFSGGSKAGGFGNGLNGFAGNSGGHGGSGSFDHGSGSVSGGGGGFGHHGSGGGGFVYQSGFDGFHGSRGSSGPGFGHASGSSFGSGLSGFGNQGASGGNSFGGGHGVASNSGGIGSGSSFGHGGSGSGGGGGGGLTAGFGGGSAFSGHDGGSGFSGGYDYSGGGGGQSHGSGGFQQTPIIHKSVYVHIAPPEDDVPKQRIIMPSMAPKKNYQIVFIKAPTPPPPAVPVIPSFPPQSDKTLIYVLHPKPEEAPPIHIPAPPQAVPVKPEVYFIRYKTRTSQDHGGSGLGAGGGYHRRYGRDGPMELDETLETSDVENRALAPAVENQVPQEYEESSEPQQQQLDSSVDGSIRIVRQYTTERGNNAH